MGQCFGKTKNGLRCLYSVKAGTRYCYRHIDQDTTVSENFVTMGVGALIGNLVAPGLGGVLGGAIAAKTSRWLSEKEIITKKRVFVSFDFDNDRHLKHLLIGQSKHPDSPFAIADWSLKEAAPENNWKSKAHAAILRSDMIVVLVGKDTHRAPGVLAEVEIARQAKKQIVQLIGQKNEIFVKVSNAGPAYSWTRENLKLIFG